MTELSFILDILLNEEKLTKSLRTKLTERVKVIEGQQQFAPRMPQIQMQHVAVPGVPTNLAPQSPSTLANLSKDEAVAQAMQAPPTARNRVVGGEIQTGNGTRGPRKF